MEGAHLASFVLVGAALRLEAEAETPDVREAVVEVVRGHEGSGHGAQLSGVSHPPSVHDEGPCHS